MVGATLPTAPSVRIANSRQFSMLNRKCDLCCLGRLGLPARLPCSKPKVNWLLHALPIGRTPLAPIGDPIKHRQPFAVPADIYTLRASGFAGVHKFRIIAQYQIWALRPATLKRGPFESAFAPCANKMVYGRHIRYICLLCDNPCVFQIFVAPSNP